MNVIQNVRAVEDNMTGNRDDYMNIAGVMVHLNTLCIVHMILSSIIQGLHNASLAELVGLQT